jgi:hypothetical protein
MPRLQKGAVYRPPHHRQTSRRAGAGRPVGRQYHNSRQLRLKRIHTWRHHHGQPTSTKTFWSHCFNPATINNWGWKLPNGTGISKATRASRNGVLSETACQNRLQMAALYTWRISDRLMQQFTLLPNFLPDINRFTYEHTKSLAWNSSYKQDTVQTLRHNSSRIFILEGARVPSEASTCLFSDIYLMTAIAYYTTVWNFSSIAAWGTCKQPVSHTEY